MFIRFGIAILEIFNGNPSAVKTADRWVSPQRDASGAKHLLNELTKNIQLGIKKCLSNGTSKHESICILKFLSLLRNFLSF